MSEVVLDASAIFALLLQEPGADVVEKALGGSFVSTVNVAEVAGKLAEKGMPGSEIASVIDAMGFHAAPFDSELAIATGLLRPRTRSAGLSLGDRACLALAKRLELPVLTADRRWKGLRVGVEVRFVRV